MRLKPLIYGVFWVTMASAGLAQDCRDDDVWKNNLNPCAIVLANYAEQEMQRTWTYVQDCYERFHNHDRYKRTEDVPSWWPGDGETPLTYLKKAQDAWTAYRTDECRGRVTDWEGSHFRFAGNFCLLTETEARISQLHSTAQSCRIWDMTGKELDPSFPAYETDYRFITQ